MSNAIKEAIRVTPWFGYVFVLLAFVSGIATVSFAAAISQRSERSSAQIKVNRQTIKLLCSRGYILADVIQGGIAVVEAERRDPNIPAATHRADDVFLKRFRMDLREITADTNDPDSLCYSEKRP